MPNLNESDLRNDTFDVTKSADKAYSQMVKAENDKFRIADYRRKRLCKTDTGEIYEEEVFVSAETQTEEMCHRKYQLLPIPIDPGGRMGPLGMAMYYGPNQNLYADRTTED